MLDENRIKPLSLLKDDPGFAQPKWFSLFRLKTPLEKFSSKQDVEDSSEAIQECLDSGGDTKPSEYLKSKDLNNEESESMEGEITLTELDHALFKKMKGSSAPGIDGFIIN